MQALTPVDSPGTARGASAGVEMLARWPCPLAVPGDSPGTAQGAPRVEECVRGVVGLVLCGAGENVLLLSIKSQLISSQVTQS